MRANTEEQHAGLILFKCYPLCCSSARNSPTVGRIRNISRESGEFTVVCMKNFSLRGLVCEAHL